MSLEGLALARNLALILLVVEAVVLAIPLLVVPFYAIKYMRRIKAPIRPWLREVQRGTEQAERVSTLASAVAVQPVFWIWAASAGLKRAVGYLVKRR